MCLKMICFRGYTWQCVRSLCSGITAGVLGYHMGCWVVGLYWLNVGKYLLTFMLCPSPQ